MKPQEITKEWINRLPEYIKERRMHPEGTVLMLPTGTDVPDEVRAHALERNIKIIGSPYKHGCYPVAEKWAIDLKQEE